MIEITGPPAPMLTPLGSALRARTEPKAEARSPFWCEVCGVAIPICEHRAIYAQPPRHRRGP